MSNQLKSESFEIYKRNKLKVFICPKKECMGDLVYDHSEADYKCEECGKVWDIQDVPRLAEEAYNNRKYYFEED